MAYIILWPHWLLPCMSLQSLYIITRLPSLSHNYVLHSICVTTAKCCPRCLPSKVFYFLMGAPGHLNMLGLFTLASIEALPRNGQLDLHNLCFVSVLLPGWGCCPSGTICPKSLFAEIPVMVVTTFFLCTLITGALH